MEKTPKKGLDNQQIKSALKVLNKLSNSLNLLLAKSNKVYLLPDIEVENILIEWNKYKATCLKVDVFCENYIEQRMKEEGDNFDYSNMQLYVKEMRLLVNNFKKMNVKYYETNL